MELGFPPYPDKLAQRSQVPLAWWCSDSTVLPCTVLGESHLCSWFEVFQAALLSLYFFESSFSLGWWKLLCQNRVSYSEGFCGPRWPVIPFSSCEWDKLRKFGFCSVVEQKQILENLTKDGLVYWYNHSTAPLAGPKPVSIPLMLAWLLWRTEFKIKCDKTHQWM